jgi:hypothetical protein
MRGKGKGHDKGKTMNSWFLTKAKGKFGKGKGKPPALGSRKPKFTGTCSHCGIVGHMARDCYKRQQETPKTVKQNTVSYTNDTSTSPNLTQKPDLIQFQKFPMFMKQRKLEGSSTNEESDEDKTNDGQLTSSQDDPPTWGKRNNPTQDEENYEWGDTPAVQLTRHNSHDRNPHRSGICQYCDTPIGSKRINGPLPCYSCRLLLNEDKEHDKEQQQYEDRRQANEETRQANYKAQLAGTVENPESQQLETTQTGEKDEDKRWGEKDADQPPLISTVPEEASPPKPTRELPQNFTRIKT